MSLILMFLNNQTTSQRRKDLNTRSFKFFALALLAGGFALISQFPSASAHDGHKKGHAPATAKNLRNPVEHNTANIENGKALYEANCAVCHDEDGKGEQYNKKAKIKVPDLKSLTDENFLTDPRFSDPWKPRSTTIKTRR